MMEFVKVCGICGILSLVVTLGLLIVGIALIGLRSNSRKVLRIFLVLSLIPAVVGVLGTASGYSQVSGTAELVEVAEPEIISHGQKMARYPTYLGVVCTGVLYLVFLGGNLMKRSEQ